MLLKENQISIPSADGSQMMIECGTGEMTFVAPASVKRYWKGTIDEFQSALGGMFGQAQGAGGGMPDMGKALGGLFGGESDDPDELNVRVTKVGDETIAGYESEHYLVETGDGNDWETYEEIWISGDLLRDVLTEVGECIEMALSLGQELSTMGPSGMADVTAVLASPDYQALFGRGYPVRSERTMQMFGMTMDMSTEVVEVNDDSIPDSAFDVPSGYQRAESPFELFGM